MTTHSIKTITAQPAHHVLEIWQLLDDQAFTIVDFQGVEFEIRRITRDQTGKIRLYGHKLNHAGRRVTDASWECYLPQGTR